MNEIFYFGANLRASLVQSFRDAGYNLVHLRHLQGLHELTSGTLFCGGVLIEWRSLRDQRIIAEAKTADLPVLVVTPKLIAAFQAAKPAADLYLEEPAADWEIVAILQDLMAAKAVACAKATPARASLQLCGVS